MVHMQRPVFLTLLKTQMSEFNLTSRTNETRLIKWHETCKCKFRLDASLCNNKREWNNDKCRCGWKKSIHKETSDK